MYYECLDCVQTSKTSKCEHCGHEALRMLQLFSKGDIVIDDDGRELIITSGNMENAKNGSVYDLSVNIHYVRAKCVDHVSNQLFPTDDEGDFIWYERRIIRKKEVGNASI